MFEYFIEKDLISHDQSGFKLGESGINQLLSIKHEIYKCFNEGYGTKRVFLEILKVLIRLGVLRVVFSEGGRGGVNFNLTPSFIFQEKLI